MIRGDKYDPDTIHAHKFETATKQHASFELPRFLDLTLGFERVMLILGRSPAGRGIGHQIMCEELYSFPGTVSVSQTMFPNLLGQLTCDRVTHSLVARPQEISCQVNAGRCGGGKGEMYDEANKEPLGSEAREDDE